MGESKAFKIKVGVHHDSAFSPLLFDHRAEGFV